MRWVKLRNLTNKLLSTGGRTLQPAGSPQDENWFPYKWAQFMAQDMTTGEINTEMVEIIGELDVPEDLTGGLLWSLSARWRRP